MVSVVVDQDTCTACMTCVNICPMGVFEDTGGTVVVAMEDQCIVCRACEASCPSDALVVED